MKATQFECRRPILVHQIIVAVAVLTYVIDRDDVIWRFVKDTAEPHKLERYLFIVATLFVAVGAGIATWARAQGHSNSSSGNESRWNPRHARYFGELCYAIGFGSLLPLAGFMILVLGDALRVYRLSRREDDPTECATPEPHLGGRKSLPWRTAIRKEAVKWGILMSMIVFAITLKDRQADILIVASFIIGTLLNAAIFNRRRRAQEVE